MLSEQEIREIEAELAHYRDKRAACTDALKIVQRRHGWVSDEHLQEVARLLDLSPDELDGVATFYNLIFRRPVGRHVILVCDSVSCWIMGYEQLVEHLKAQFGIEMGQTTSDGRFTLLPVPCLGHCDRAPALMVDDDMHIDLDAARLDEVLERYR